MASASSSSTPEATVSGSLANPKGGSFDFSAIGEADSITHQGNCGSGNAQYNLLIVLSTRSGSCSAFESSAYESNSEVIYLSIITQGPAGSSAPPAIASGVFPLGNPVTDQNGNTITASVDVIQYASACGITSVDTTGMTGTITINSVNGNVVGGSFSVHYANAGSLSGTFDAPDCSLTPSEFCSAASKTGCR